MEITDAMVLHIANLSKLALSETEVCQAKLDMEEMLQTFGKLCEADMEGVEPMYHVHTGENVFREDAPVKAKEESQGAYIVPHTIG